MLHSLMLESTLFLMMRIFKRERNLGQNYYEQYKCHKNKEHLVMPVFYGVTPSFIREYVKQTFGEAFNSIITNTDNYSVKENPRKQALTDASNLAGWDMSNY
ncbi:TMV resistance protein N-like, partial [Trifolium medium]|nr:TMV resistance protein N-like [Trifolium medium]